jgi:uncharacterized protein YbbC (DUF1343 family)
MFRSGAARNMPFEVVGAPWIDGQRSPPSSPRPALPASRSNPPTSHPTENRYKGVLLPRRSLRLENRAVFDPVRTGMAMALALRKLHGKDWDAARLRRMLGDPAVAQAILDLRPLSEIEALFKDDLDAFRAKRAKYLLYAP